MNLKILFVMSLLALSTLAIAAQPDASDNDDIEAQVVKSVEDSVGKRLVLLQAQR